MDNELTIKEYEMKAGKNIIWSVISNVALRILGLVFFVFISSKLLETGIGKYGFILYFVGIWFIFYDIGFSGYLSREWARKEKPFAEIEEDYYYNLTLRLIAAIIFFVPFIIINYYFNREILFLLILAYLSSFIAFYTGLSDIFLQLNNHFKYCTIRQVTERAVTIIIGIILVFVWPRLEMVFLATIIGQIVSLSYYYLTVLPFKFKFLFSWQKTKILAKKSYPFLFLSVLTTIYARIDIVMLRFFDSFGAVGWYTTAYRFIDLAVMFSSTFFIPSIFTILSGLHQQKDRKNFNSFFYKSLRIIFSSSLLIVLGIIFLSPYLINWLFPASFAPTILALRILILIQIFSSFGIFFNNLLLIQNKEKTGLYVVIFSATFNIALNLFLIPRYSLYGAAWATVISESVSFYLLQRFTAWPKNYPLIFKMVVVLIINAIACLILKFSGQLNNLYFDALILVINLFLIFKMGLFKKEDLELITNPIKLKFNNHFNNNLN